MIRRAIIEADGGSRGNPGPASFGSVLINADTGEVVAELGETIGVATNNVAEYRGLIGGLTLATEHAPGAVLDVRMDSKLVIEQMAGRWKIKHPGMKPLALEAQALVRQFPSVSWTWVPREENRRADALVNAALDSDPVAEVTYVKEPEPRVEELSLFDQAQDEATAEGLEKRENPAQGWRFSDHQPTTLLMVRHGVTEMTERKAFSGTGGVDPALTERGVAQAQRAADYLKHLEPVDVVIASPLLRTRQTAENIAHAVGADIEIEEGFAEANFGEWDGYTFKEIMDRWPDHLQEWLSATHIAPPGGESFDQVRQRVETARQKVLRAYEGKRIVIATHVTPIKLVVREAIDAPMSVLYTLDVAPASITTTSWWPGGDKTLSNFSVQPGPF